MGGARRRTEPSHLARLHAHGLAGAVSMWLLQNAYSAGRLEAARPGLTLLDPFAAIVWGLLVVDERARDGVFAALAVVSGVVMAGGAVALSRAAKAEARRRRRPIASRPRD